MKYHQSFFMTSYKYVKERYHLYKIPVNISYGKDGLCHKIIWHDPEFVIIECHKFNKTSFTHGKENSIVRFKFLESFTST